MEEKLCRYNSIWGIKTWAN